MDASQFILKLIEKSSDPVILADSNANIVWFNQSAGKLFCISKSCKVLGDIFQGEMNREILGCEHFTAAEVRAIKMTNIQEKMTAIITCLAGEDPDDDTFLIVAKPSNVVKNAFADQEDSPSTLAHDLKNPLGAIFGYADAMLETPIGAGLKDKQRDIMSRVRSTAARSIELVRNIQHLSQLNIGSSKRHGPLDLNAMVETVVHHTFRDNPHEPKVSTNLFPKPLPVSVDRIALDRVLTNLYSNALKFTPEIGSIVLKTFAKDGKACFAITNSAPVIPKDEIDSLFARHYRGSTSRGISGSGLGLYIVKQIVQHCGGAIEVSSSSAEGTTFTVLLPMLNTN